VRDDGYHELRTVFRSIALHDRLIRAAIGNFVIQANDPTCPTDSSNLVCAQPSSSGARSQAPRFSAARVRIDARPSEAGLGGGSSDGAAALRVFRGLWCPKMSTSRLHDLAMTLGADAVFPAGRRCSASIAADRLFSLNEPPMI
jgi:4-diphosphocytidyl-2-C-methyl-D-erythritol kinase